MIPGLKPQEILGPISKNYDWPFCHFKFMKCIILIYVREVCSVLRHNSSIFLKNIQWSPKSLICSLKKKGDQENRCTEQVAKKKTLQNRVGLAEKTGPVWAGPTLKRTFSSRTVVMCFASLKRQPPGVKPQLQGDPGARGHLHNVLLFPKLEFPFFLFLLPMRI